MAVWAGLEEIDCSHCTKQLKKLRGCEGFGEEKEIRVFDEKIKISCCPVKEITLETRIFLEAYHFYKRGFLPSAGAWSEQSARVIEAFMFLDNLFSGMEKKEREKMMSKKNELISKRNH